MGKKYLYIVHVKGHSDNDRYPGHMISYINDIHYVGRHVILKSSPCTDLISLTPNYPRCLIQPRTSPILGEESLRKMYILGHWLIVHIQVGVKLTKLSDSGHTILIGKITRNSSHTSLYNYFKKWSFCDKCKEF